MAVAFEQAKTDQFRAYGTQILANAQAMANQLMSHGYKIATGGTENHLCLVDLRPNNTDGARAEHVLEMVSIACNKNTAPGDKSALRPGGIRLGAPALTSRDLKEADFKQVADFIHEGIQLTLVIQKDAGHLLKDFKAACEKPEHAKAIADLRERVEKFSRKFPMPGYEDF